MVVNESLIYAIPEELMGGISGLISILKVIGFAVIVYIIFAIIEAVLNRKKVNEIKRINNNLEEIKTLLSNKSVSQKNS